MPRTGRPRTVKGAGSTGDVQSGPLKAPGAIGEISGPGRWLVVEYRPTALFSLKISLATSSVGKTLIVPTPYAIKMAYVDGGFRVGWTETDCNAFLRSLVDVEIRIAPDLLGLRDSSKETRKTPSFQVRGSNCSLHVEVLGTATDKPEIRGRCGEFYSHLSSAWVTPTKAGYTTSSFRPILRIMDNKPLTYCHSGC